MTRWARGALGVGVLLWLAAPFWSEQIDDVYISAAYAQQLVEAGALRWPNGALSEGYSNPLWVGVLAIFTALGGDVPLLAQLASLLCGAGLIAFANHTLPMDRLGTLLLIGLSGWMPLTYWSAMGMETVGYALLLAVGWCALRKRRPAGVMWLTLCTLLRPEAHLLWLLGLMRMRHRRGLVAASVMMMAAYHGSRIAYFGALRPGPAVAKLNLSPFVLPQLALEGMSAAPLLIAVLWGWRPKREAVLWAGFPVLVGLLSLVIIGGDWMGQGRLWFPGIIAAVLSLAPRGCPPQQPPLAAWLVILVMGRIQLPFLDIPTFRLPTLTPWHTYAQGLQTSLSDDVAYLVQQAPDGRVVLSADVGMPAFVPGLTIVDSYGLTDPRFAAGRETNDWSALAEWLAGPQRPALVRVARFVPDWIPDEATGPHPILDPWLRDLEGGFTQTYTLRDELVITERGWTGWVRYWSDNPDRPDRSTQQARWAAMAARFPSQPWLGWRLAMATASLDLEEAASLAHEQAARWPQFPPWRSLEHALDFPLGDEPTVFVPGQGFQIRPGASRQRLGPVPSPLTLSGPGRVLVRCDGRAWQQPSPAVVATPDCTSKLQIEGLEGVVYATLGEK
ncbi:MAG: hypothetical protein AAFV53_06155 [Myxococcota bacterium]